MVNVKSNLVKVTVGVLLVALSSLTSAQPTQSSVELCLALDGSGSINITDFNLQLEGYASAIEDSSIVPRDSTVSIIVVQFSTASQLELGPITVDSDATANQLAADIRNIARLSGGTNIASAVQLCTDTFQYLTGFRQVIDVSTDGDDPGASSASDSAVAAGVDAINALGVGSGIDINQLNSLVRPQPASAIPDPGFVLLAPDFAAFTPAVEAKIRAEITGGGPSPSFESVPGLSPLGLILLTLVLGLVSFTRLWTK